MTKFKVGLALAALAVLCAATEARATVVLTNGSFETVTGSDLGSGIYLADGWVDTSALLLQAASAAAGFESTNITGIDGARFLRLASDNPDPQNTGSIYQDMGTMVAGLTYTITGTTLGGDAGALPWAATIRLASDGSASPTTVYAFDHVSLASQGEVGAFSISYTADAADAGNSLILSLTADPSGPGQARRGGVDNLMLTTIPEPMSAALLGAGLLGLALVRRRAG